MNMFESRAAVLAAEAQERLVVAQTELQRVKNSRAVEALEMLLAVVTEPAGFEGKFGRELDLAIERQKLKLDAAIAAAQAALKC